MKDGITNQFNLGHKVKTIINKQQGTKNGQGNQPLFHTKQEAICNKAVSQIKSKKKTPNKKKTPRATSSQF